MRTIGGALLLIQFSGRDPTPSRGSSYNRGLSLKEGGMGRLVNAQKGDYGLHNATFISKLPHSLPSAEEWNTESDVLYKSEKGEFFYYVTTGLQTQLREHVYLLEDAQDALRWFDERVELIRRAIG
jgi:hypothetical protein